MNGHRRCRTVGTSVLSPTTVNLSHPGSEGWRTFLDSLIRADYAKLGLKIMSHIQSNASSATLPPASGRRRPSTLTAGVFVAVVFFFVMVPVSFLGYTSIGFDFEYAEGPNVVERFYRARWPGDGSFRLGLGAIYYSLDEEDVDTIDLAGRLLEPPTHELTRTSWLRFGIATGVPEGDRGRLDSSTWLVVPSTFPPLLLSAGLLVRRWWQRRTAATH